MRTAWPWLALVCALSSSRLASAEPALPAVHARFELRSHGHREQLELVRDGERIEYRFLSRGYSELWRRDARGELEHVRSYPSAGKSVHYTAGDLRTIGLEADWTSLSSLLSTAEQAQLRAGKSRRELGHEVRSLQGMLRGKPAHVEWLADVALPKKLALGEGKSQVVVSLLTVEACTRVLCGERDEALRSLEFADLGDMEYDPFVRRFLAHDALEHGHAHGVH
jgi:hypothetical protein